VLQAVGEEATPERALSLLAEVGANSNGEIDSNGSL
jgi:hypothetical protein